MKLQRYAGNPILEPNPRNRWESMVSTNPAVWYEKEAGKVIMLYRAAGNDPEHLVYLGLAESTDGYHFTRMSDLPALAPITGNFDGGAIEDPRIVRMEDWYYVTYACRPFPGGQYWLAPADRPYNFSVINQDFPEPLRSNYITSALAFTKDFKSWIRAGIMTDRKVMDHDVIIFPEKINGKYAVMHRPDYVGEKYGTTAPSMWLSVTDDLLNIASTSRLLAKAEFDWEGFKIGGNAPPLRTELGWLVIYHGVSNIDRYYRLGVMILDINDPGKVIYRAPEPIFEPEETYEKEGYYRFKGVVFPCGNLIMNDKLMVYYGAADRCVGVATADLGEMLQWVKQYPVKP